MSPSSLRGGPATLRRRPLSSWTGQPSAVGDKLFPAGPRQEDSSSGTVLTTAGQPPKPAARQNNRAGLPAFHTSHTPDRSTWLPAGSRAQRAHWTTPHNRSPTTAWTASNLRPRCTLPDSRSHLAPTVKPRAWTHLSGMPPPSAPLGPERAEIMADLNLLVDGLADVTDKCSGTDLVTHAVQIPAFFHMLSAPCLRISQDGLSNGFPVIWPGLGWPSRTDEQCQHQWETSWFTEYSPPPSMIASSDNPTCPAHVGRSPGRRLLRPDMNHGYISQPGPHRRQDLLDGLRWGAVGTLATRATRPRPVLRGPMPSSPHLSCCFGTRPRSQVNQAFRNSRAPP